MKAKNPGLTSLAGPTEPRRASVILLSEVKTLLRQGAKNYETVQAPEAYSRKRYEEGKKLLPQGLQPIPPRFQCEPRKSPGGRLRGRGVTKDSKMSSIGARCRFCDCLSDYWVGGLSIQENGEVPRRSWGKWGQ